MIIIIFSGKQLQISINMTQDSDETSNSTQIEASLFENGTIGIRNKVLIKLPIRPTYFKHCSQKH